MPSPADLPPPTCPRGYTTDDLHTLLQKRYPDFLQWHNGQTCSICDGQIYDHDAKTYKPSPCAGDTHGIITYVWDVERFLRGLGDAEWAGSDTTYWQAKGREMVGDDAPT